MLASFPDALKDALFILRVGFVSWLRRKQRCRFIQFATGFTDSFPDVHVDIKRVFADGDFVITHALLTGAVPVYGPLGSKVVDIFRLDANGKVVEHWDVIAQISPTSENGNPEV